MLQKNIFIPIFFVLLTVLSTTAKAQETPANPDVAAGTLLTVSDIKIDKKDKDAVAAKEKAVIEAKRQAMAELAKRFLEPADAAKYKLPDDQTISTLVMDFEVKNEKLSANRYIADFTVNFNENAVSYIKGDTSFSSSAQTNSEQSYSSPYATANNTSTTASAPDQYSSPAGKKLLVLPFYKTSYGKNILWEDPNPWRNAWKYKNGYATPSGITIIVPAGDMADIELGTSADIWDSNPATIKRLKDKYGATDVMITLGEITASGIKADIYNYRKENFNLDKSIDAQLIGIDFQPAISDVLNNEEILLGNGKAAPAPKTADVRNVITAKMQLSSFKDWMEAQKRISSIIPKIAFDIVSLNNSEVELKIFLPSGGLSEVQNKFYARGLEIKPEDSGENSYTLTLKPSETPAAQ